MICHSMCASIWCGGMQRTQSWHPARCLHIRLNTLYSFKVGFSRQGLYVYPWLSCKTSWPKTRGFASLCCTSAGNKFNYTSWVFSIASSTTAKVCKLLDVCLTPCCGLFDSLLWSNQRACTYHWPLGSRALSSAEHHRMFTLAHVRSFSDKATSI